MNQGTLTLINSPEDKWYPNSIYKLESHLHLIITTEHDFPQNKLYPLFKNIAYSLQYIEFQIRVLQDINHSSVIWTQIIKSIVIHGASIIESIYFYLITINKVETTTEWQLDKLVKTPIFKINDSDYIQEISIYKKLDVRKVTQMTFDQMSKKVEKKKLIGEDFPFYHKIKALRMLRNKIHIHDSINSFDHDYNNFGNTQLATITEVLHSILVSNIFKENEYHYCFDFLHDISNNCTK